MPMVVLRITGPIAVGVTKTLMGAVPIMEKTEVGGIRILMEQAYPEVAIEAEQGAVAEMKSAQKPLALELALKEFMKCHSDMDTEELLDAFYKEYNKKWDDYYVKEEKRQIKTKIR